MATSTSGSSSTGLSSSSPPSPSSSDTSGLGNIPPISLCLYIFSVTLILFLLILGAFVSRSVRRRRQRNAGVLAALNTGAYGPTTGFRGKHDRLSALKPVLWESRIMPMDDEAEGWSHISPVAGAALVPVPKTPEHDAKFRHLAAWRSRLHFSPRQNKCPIVTNPSPITPPMEALASSPDPMHLTVLISMPSAHMNAGKENGEPPVVELGVAQATFTPNVTR